MKNEEKNISNKDMFIENLSPMDFNTTVEKLSKEIEKKSWGIQHIYDLQKTLEEKGKKVLPVKVLSVCQPEYASRVLEKDFERIISSLMPCRISVYEKSNGKTYVSWMDSWIVASNYGGIVQEVMTDSVNEVKEIVEKALARN